MEEEPERNANFGNKFSLTIFLRAGCDGGKKKSVRCIASQQEEKEEEGVEGEGASKRKS